MITTYYKIIKKSNCTPASERKWYIANTVKYWYLGNLSEGCGNFVQFLQLFSKSEIISKQKVKRGQIQGLLSEIFQWPPHENHQMGPQYLTAERTDHKLPGHEFRGAWVREVQLSALGPPPFHSAGKAQREQMTPQVSKNTPPRHVLQNSQIPCRRLERRKDEAGTDLAWTWKF